MQMLGSLVVQIPVLPRWCFLMAGIPGQSTQGRGQEIYGVDDQRHQCPSN
ncbi:unnamed protein product [Prunus brigantina]